MTILMVCTQVKKNSTISIVKFSDYNCSYCKKAHKDIVKIKKTFQKLKLFIRTFQY